MPQWTGRSMTEHSAGTSQGHPLVLFRDFSAKHSPQAPSIENPSALFLHPFSSHQHNEAAAVGSKNIARSLEPAR